MITHAHVDQQQAAYRRSLLWRIHFWAALVATPFTLVAVLTGLVYVFTPQIEQALYGHLDKVKPMDGSLLTLDTMVHSAHGAVPPGWRLHAAVPPHARDASAQVVFTPPESAANPAAASEHMHGGAQQVARPKRAGFGWPAAALVVYVNPYTAEVLGQLPHQERFNQWAKRLHSRLLQDENWRWMIELAASWMVVMLITGIYLWWPQENAVIAVSGQNQRSKWKRWHSWTGVSLALVSLVILATGLTWSKYAGGIVRDLRDLSGQAPPVMPANLVSTPRAGMVAMDWQTAWEATKRHAPDISVQLTPPSGPQDIWRATQHDRSQPTKRFDLALDAYSAQPLYLSGWQQQTIFGQATAIGIPFHRGEFGWWNQAVLAIFGLGLLFSLVSGWVMFFKREQAVWKLLLSGPPMRIWRSMPAGFWVAAVLMMALMPMLALSAACLLAALYALRRQSHGA